MYIEVRNIYAPVAEEKLPIDQCPMCNSSGNMAMTFYSEHTRTAMVSVTNNATTASVFCSACGAHVPVEKWTPGFESFFKQKKQALSLHRKRKLGPLFYVLMGLCVLGLGFAFYIIKNGLPSGENSYEKRKAVVNSMLKAPMVGDIYLVADKKEGLGSCLMPYKVVSVTDSELVAIPHKKPDTDHRHNLSDFDLTDASFGEEEKFTIDKKHLMNVSIWQKPGDFANGRVILDAKRK
jgi:hypothetical protein